jgi:hypothetical protein
MAKALARFGDADQVVQIELMANSRQHLERQVKQGGQGVSL